MTEALTVDSMIDIKRELSILFLSLRLAQAVESHSEKTEFELFRIFAGIIRSNDKDNDKKENK